MIALVWLNKSEWQPDVRGYYLLPYVPKMLHLSIDWKYKYRSRWLRFLCQLWNDFPVEQQLECFSARNTCSIQECFFTHLACQTGKHEILVAQSIAWSHITMCIHSDYLFAPGVFHNLFGSWVYSCLENQGNELSALLLPSIHFLSYDMKFSDICYLLIPQNLSWVLSWLKSALKINVLLENSFTGPAKDVV